MVKNKNSKAYTMMEILICLLILTFIILLVVIPFSKNINRAGGSKLIGPTTNFFRGVENSISYLQTTKRLQDANDDGALNSADLFAFFEEKMDGEPTDECSIFANYLETALHISIPASQGGTGEEPPAGGGSGTSIPTDFTCGIFNNNVIAAFYFDPKCRIQAPVKEYFTLLHDDEVNPETGQSTVPIRTVTKACGYVAYTLNTLKNEIATSPQLGENIFTIGLGKGYIK